MDIGFLVKKTVAYFFEPFGMVLILFIIGLFFLLRSEYKSSKIFLSLSFSLLFLYAYPPFANFLVENLEDKYPKHTYKSNIKYIHVLGNGHTTDPSQPLSSQLSSTSVKRNIEGIIIHLNTPGSKLIFTGYGGDSKTQTATMNQMLALSLGVLPENIIVSGLPKDTREEGIFVKSIVGDNDYIVVTSATHMHRSILLFQSLGMYPIAAPTNYYKTEFNGYLKLPTIQNFEKSQIAMHEYLGIIWNTFKRINI